MSRQFLDADRAARAPARRRAAVFGAAVEIGDGAPRERERVGVVARQRVGDAGDAGVQIAAAEILGADRLAGRRLHQRRPAEEDRALLLDDDRLVRHRRHIGAARRAGAHHHGDLRDALRRHARLVVEDAAEMLAVGKHLGLMRQIGAAGIDEIDAGQPVLERDLLRAQMLLHRHRIVGAALDRRIVGDDHRLAARDPADAGDQAGAVHVALVHAEGGERADFEERRAGIDQPRHALAREAACRVRDAARASAAALGRGGAARREIGQRRAPAGGIVGVGMAAERPLRMTVNG